LVITVEKMKEILLGLTRAELKDLMEELGEKEYRAGQVAGWIYHSGIKEIDRMRNLPVEFRQRLAERYEVGRSTIEKISRSDDRAFKLLLGLSDGALVESVGMPYADRFSCCVSTQVGCAMACLFCATGSGGFKRNLAAGEIIDQVLSVQETAMREKLLTGGQDRVSHVVFMGMGEPLLNYAVTLKAVALLNSELNIGMRSITVSTIGYVPGIYKLAQEHLQLTLAVSLHAPDDELRRKLVPGMPRYSIKDIVGACKDYVKETGRRVTFEYCLLKAVNDSDAAAQMLAALLKGINCHVNLIPFNSVTGSGFRRPGAERVTAFRRVLETQGITVTQREQRGAGINAACGQLRRLT